jgi:hypothetical protein
MPQQSQEQHEPNELLQPEPMTQVVSPAGVVQSKNNHQTMMMMNPNVHFHSGLAPQMNPHHHLPNNGFGVNGAMGLAGLTQQRPAVIPMMWQATGTFPPQRTSTMPHSLPVDYSNLPTPITTTSTTNILPSPASLQYHQQRPATKPISDATTTTVSTTSTTGTKRSGTKATKGGGKGKSSKQAKQTDDDETSSESSDGGDGGGGNPAVKEQQCRERNREHARSTRLRKKAYIQKLKDMAQGLRAVQTEEIRRRRVSMQKMLEIQKVRRSVIQTVLHYHAVNERDPDKWNALLEESFWLKQPVTPFRSFRRSGVERVR